MTGERPELRADLLTEFDGTVCPACHHEAHDPGGCSECPRCELHTDEALAFVLRYEPDLVARLLCKDPEHPLGAWCADTTGLDRCHDPEAARLAQPVEAPAGCLCPTFWHGVLPPPCPVHNPMTPGTTVTLSSGTGREPESVEDTDPLAELRELSENATPPNWYPTPYADSDGAVVSIIGATTERFDTLVATDVDRDDAAFIVAAVDYVRALTAKSEAPGEPWRVHDHGVEDGSGIGCREVRLNGRLIGWCLIAQAVNPPPRSEAPIGAEPRFTVAEIVRLENKARALGRTVLPGLEAPVGAETLDVLPVVRDKHGAHLPVAAIVRALPRTAQLTGLWVQYHGDGTDRAPKGEVVVSIQYGWSGSYLAKDGRGPTVNAASEALLAALGAGTEREEP